MSIRRQVAVEGKRTRNRRVLIEAGATVLAILIVVFAVRLELLAPFYIPTSSMSPTLQVGDLIVVNQLAPEAAPLHRGDVVVFTNPGGWLPGSDDHLAKRVIALPGDIVTCCQEGRLVVNGQRIDERYLLDPGANTPFEAIVPAAHIWVMGDDRDGALDSRTMGPVPIENVTGVVLARIWPVSRLSGPLNDPQVFAKVEGRSWISTTRRAR